MNVNKPNTERRQHQRIKNNVPLKLSHDLGDSVTETFNLSRSGAYCQVQGYIEPMTKMKIQLLLPLQKNGKTVSKKMICQGVVVRVEPSDKKDHFNVAVFFNEMSDKNSEALADYVNHVLKKNV
ncbi:MAG: PilZ domain-containing protein [Candidatus Omnitrophica bacterium]|nr:PilZ domain-containing protein [Candidatus Omnitrophota bacterium]